MVGEVGGLFFGLVDQFLNGDLRWCGKTTARLAAASGHLEYAVGRGFAGST